MCGDTTNYHHTRSLLDPAILYNHDAQTRAKQYLLGCSKPYSSVSVIFTINIMDAPYLLPPSEIVARLVADKSSRTADGA